MQAILHCICHPITRGISTLAFRSDLMVPTAINVVVEHALLVY